MTPDAAHLLAVALLYLMGAAALAFAWAPFLAKLLYKYNITRRAEFDFTLQGERQHKAGTPIMGGILVIVTVIIVTVLFNWNRKYTYVPIGAMTVAALLGAADDILNILGIKRRLRSLRHILQLRRVHKKRLMRAWHTVMLPFVAMRNFVGIFGSKQERGIQVHEKLILQFLAGLIAAWWVYFRLGESWHTLWIPFDGQVYVGWWIIPIIIFFVMFTANAVNVADGLDGLAGGSLIAAFGGLTLVSWLEGRTAFAPLNATVVGALIAYTYFNVKPARFQMGDVGSLGLGALLAINAIAVNKTLLIPILGFIFYVEIISVILQVLSRYSLGRRLFKMSPLHHHFEIKGWNEEKIVMRFWLIQMFMVVVAVWLAIR